MKKSILIYLILLFVENLYPQNNGLKLGQVYYNDITETQKQQSNELKISSLSYLDPIIKNAVNTSSSQAALLLSDIGSGIDRIVTIESIGQFRLIFEAADNWGIDHWYDLVNDPDATTNLVFSSFSDTGVSEPGLFQMVWYGTVPDDPKLYMMAAKYYQPNAGRSFTILENTPQRIIVEAVSHPLLHSGVLENITVSAKYYIYPDGKLYLTTRMMAINPQTISDWRCAVIGLCDPTSLPDIIDTEGWIRSSATQNPYEWTGQTEKYLFAYWSKNTGEPYTNWTKASILLVPYPENQFISTQGRHHWNWFKRWHYTCYDISMHAGDTITHNYLIQLGAENSFVLPNIIDSSIANPIADAYISDPIHLDNKNSSQSAEFNLFHNYPNPFSDQTTISFAVSVPDHYSLKIYDFTGREVSTLINKTLTAGEYIIEWNGTTTSGQPLGNGVYFYELKYGTYSEVQKCLLLK